MKQFYRALILFLLVFVTTLSFTSCGDYCLHKAADPIRENIVAPTILVDGSYDEVLICEKCGKELAREQKAIIYDGATLIADIPGVVIDGVSISARLSHNTATLDLSAVLSTTEEASFALFSDANCKNPLSSATVALTKGQTTNVYVLFKNKDGFETVYTVSLYRKNTFTVSFDSAGGTLVNTIEVEEGTLLADLDSPSKTDYVFAGWDFDFTTPITENVTLVARWNEADFLTYRVEYYLQNLTQDGYTLEQSREFTEATNSTVSAQLSHFNHFTYDASASTVSGTLRPGNFLILKVYYTRNSYTINVSAANGTVEGTGSYLYGSTATVSAGTSNRFITFNGWYIGETLLSSESAYSFTVEGDITIDANFTPLPELANFKYTVTGDNLTITGVIDRTVTEIVVPDYVYAIKQGAFANCLSLESLTIPFVGYTRTTKNDNNQYPFGYIFSSSSISGTKQTTQYYYQSPTATRYTTVYYYIPETLKHVTVTGGDILYGAFSGCSTLQSLTLTGDVKNVYANSITSCTKLVALNVGDSVKNFEFAAVSGCSKFSYTVLDGLKFYGTPSNPYLLLSGIESVSAVCRIPASTKAVSNDFLSNSYVMEFTAFEVDPANTALKSVDGVLFNGDLKTLILYPRHKQAISYEIPEGTEKLGLRAFTYCAGLVSLTVPSSVTEAGSYTFNYMYKTVEIINHSSLSITGTALHADFVAESALDRVGDFVFYTKDGVNYLIGYEGTDTVISLPASYQNNKYEIYAYAFCGNHNLTSVTVGRGISRINGNAFRNCESLTTLSIPFVGASLQGEDSDSHFSGWFTHTHTTPSPGNYLAIPASLKHVIVTDAESIELAAFMYCDTIERITLCEGVKSIAANAFYQTTGLKSIDLPQGLESIGDNSFTQSGLTALVLPEGLKTIGVGSFNYCRTLETITLPSTLESIGNNAFDWCESITELHIPASVTSIGDYAFSCCLSLQSFTVDGQNNAFITDGKALYSKDGKALYQYALGNTAAAYTIPSTVERICKGAFFYANSSLTTVAFPEQLKTIEDHAFEEAFITSAVLPEGLIKIGQYAFASTQLDTVVLPDTLKEVHLYAFNNTAITSCTTFGGAKYIGSRTNPYFMLYKPENTNITECTVHSDAKVIANDAFNSCSSALQTIYFNATNMLDLVASVSANRAYNMTVVIGKDVTHIPARLFASLNVSTLTFEEGSVCESVGDYAFANLYLTELRLPNTVTSLAPHAFSQGRINNLYVKDLSLWLSLEFTQNYDNPLCQNGMLYINGELLKHLVIDASVTEIGDYAFYGMTSLETVYIPASVTDMGICTFTGCTNVHTVTVPFLGNGDDITHFGYLFGAINSSENAQCVPSSLKNVTILSGKHISDYAFYNCSGIENVIFPDELETIGANVFYYCSSLTGVEYENLFYLGTVNNPYAILYKVNDKTQTSCTIHADTKIIYEYAFSDWRNLNGTLVIPEGVYYIGASAFYYCDDLDAIVLPSTLKHILDSTFSSCKSLREIRIPEGVETIGRYVFDGCSSLEKIYLPSTLESIDYSAFDSYDSTNMTEVHVPSLEAWIGITFANEKSNPLSCAKNLYINGELLTELYIPEGTEQLSPYAFYNAKSLEAIHFPASFKRIENSEFLLCSSLYEIHITDIAAWCAMDIENALYAFGRSEHILYVNGEHINDLVIENGIETINQYVFYGFFFNSVTIPASVKEIGSSAFGSCQRITAVHISDLAAWCEIDFADKSANPLSIAKNLYLNGTLVKNLEVPASVEEIGAYAFYGATCLESLTFLGNTTKIGDNAFFECKSLATVNLPASLECIDSYAFGYCTKLKIALTLPQGLTTIGKYAFANSAITSLTIPASLSFVGNNAFSTCGYLESIYVTDIAAWCAITFQNAEANPAFVRNLYVNGVLLETLTLPESVTSIGDYAFAGCLSLKNVTLPDRVTSVGCGTFYLCQNIQTLTTAGNATYIGTESNPYFYLLKATNTNISSCSIHPDTVYIANYAFSGCENLTSISIPNNVVAIGMGALNAKKMRTVTIGSGVRYIGVNNFSNQQLSLVSVSFGSSANEWIYANQNTLEYVGTPNLSSASSAASTLINYSPYYVFIRQ